MSQAPSEPAMSQGGSNKSESQLIPGTGNELGSQQGSQQVAREPAMSRESARCHGGSNESERQ